MPDARDSNLLCPNAKFHVELSYAINYKNQWPSLAGIPQILVNGFRVVILARVKPILEIAPQLDIAMVCWVDVMDGRCLSGLIVEIE